MEPSFAASTVSLRNNVERRIDNPLVHLEFSRLDALARNFAYKVNPLAPDIDLFVKAARIAWDPTNWETVPGLSEPEKKALENEKTARGFWEQPHALRVTVITLCLSAVIQGWIQSGINGANVTWPVDLGLFQVKKEADSQCLHNTGDRNYKYLCVDQASKWQFAVVNAITYFAASIGGSFLADPLQSWKFGRKDAVLLAACLTFASLLGAACARSWKSLLIWRVFVGLGMGAKASITPIYSAEVSPSYLRGALVMNWQQFDTFGILSGFTANLIVYYIDGLGTASWRWQIASGCLPALSLITLIWTIPESPRWLLKKGRFPEAFHSMCLLRDTPLQAARELFYANAQIQLEAQLLPDDQNNEQGATTDQPEGVEEQACTDFYAFQERVKNVDYWIRVKQLFRDKRIRRATVSALVVMVSQQLCGINVITFYSSTILQDTSDAANNSKSLWMSWGLGLANFLFTIPVYWFIDTRGRRFLLLVTYPFMFVCMLGACLSFLHPEQTTRLGLVGAFMFLFVIFYSLGQGPVAFAYSSEVFPLINREVGMSFVVFANLFGAGILTLLAPQAQFDSSSSSASGFALKQSRLLGIFVGLIAVAFVLIFFFVFETAAARRKEKLFYMSLEELNFIFAVPTKRQISYQVTYMIPYAKKTLRWKLSCWFGSATADNRPSPAKDPYSWVEATNDDQSQHAEKGDVSPTDRATAEAIETAGNGTQV